MAKKKYKKKYLEVEADQFLAALPSVQWPDEVTENPESPTGYYYNTVIKVEADGNQIYGDISIKDTDYLIYSGSSPYTMGAMEFEDKYEDK